MQVDAENTLEKQKYKIAMLIFRNFISRQYEYKINNFKYFNKTKIIDFRENFRVNLLKIHEIL